MKCNAKSCKGLQQHGVSFIKAKSGVNVVHLTLRYHNFSLNLEQRTWNAIQSSVLVYVLYHL